MNKETKAEVFWPLKRSEGLRNIILEGKTDGKTERPRRQWEKDIRDVFDMPLIDVGRLALDRHLVTSGYT